MRTTKERLFILAVGSALALTSGCSKQEDAQESENQTEGPALDSGTRIPEKAPAPKTNAEKAPLETPDRATASNFVFENALIEFSYAYPASAAAIPQLAAMLDTRSNRAIAELRGDARAARKQAQESGFPYRPYALSIEWKKVASIPRFLSLNSEIYAYTGGAHGNTGYEGMVWDREGGQALKPDNMFADSLILSETISEDFCDALDRQREQKRGAPVERSEDGFNDCIDPAEQVLILGSSNGKTFDRIGFLVGPYAAGPYVEGSYDITLPVTQAILETVKPEYRSYFSVR